MLLLASTLVLSLSVPAPRSSSQDCTEPLLLERLGPTSLGPLLEFEAGPPVLGGPFRVRLRDAEPGSLGILLTATASAPTPLPELGGTLWPAANGVLRFGEVDAHGFTTALLDLPAVATEFCGIDLFLQGAQLDTLGTVLLADAYRAVPGPPHGLIFPGQGAYGRDYWSFFDLGDFDEDGQLDLLGSHRTWTYNPSNVFARLWFARPTGLFEQGFDPGSTKAEAAFGRARDIDQDGHLDIALLARNAGAPYDELQVFRGGGDGTFAPAMSTVLDADFLDHEFADVDGDGWLDSVGCGDGLLYATRRGDGSSFVPFEETTISRTAERLLVDDLDGDGDLDLAVRLEYFSPNTKIRVRRNDGDGRFLATNTVSAPGVAVGLDSGDLDGDGLLELFAVDNWGERLWIFGGSSDLALAPPVQTVEVAGSIRLQEVLVTDLDQDGSTDLLALSRFASVHPLLGDGAGQLHPAQEIQIGGGETNGAVLDLNGDGRLDLALGGPRFLLGLGQGRFEQGFELDTPGPAFRVAFADLNGDQDSDLVLMGGYERYLETQIGDGRGDFTRESSYVLGAAPQDLLVEDIDGDGNLDVALTRQSIYDRGIVELFAGPGDGSLEPGVKLDTVDRPHDLLLGDLDGDARSDLVVGSDVQGIAWHRRSVSGEFGPAEPLVPDGGYQHLHAADLDGDGDVDLLSSRALVPVLLFNNGAAEFIEVPLESAFDRVAEMVPCDLDADGRLDLVLREGEFNNSWKIQILLGAGDGTFTEHLLIDDKFLNAHQIRAADLDGDGDQDLVLLSGAPTSNGWKLLLLENDGVLNFTATHTWPLRSFATMYEDFALGDIARDGTLDVVLARNKADRVLVLPNRLGRR